jgi:hypothetical protein
MKIKIIAATILSVISVNTMAIEMVNARIVDHREWSTGNVKSFKFTDGNAPNEAQAKMLMGKATAAANVNDAEGYSKTNTNINGTHSYAINNDTKQMHMYTYEYKLCADGNNCIYRLDHIEIGAGGHTTNSGTTMMTQYFGSAGTFDSLASTKVSGETTASAEKHGHIYIHKIG